MPQRSTSDKQESCDYDHMTEGKLVRYNESPPVCPNPQRWQSTGLDWLAELETDRPTCPSESQRVRDILTRHETRRHTARMLLKQSPPVTETPSQHEECNYSSDFTEDEDGDALWEQQSGHLRIKIKTSSGDELILTSPDDDYDDDELSMFMLKKDKRMPSTTKRESRSDSKKQAKVFDNADKLQKTDGRRAPLIPHERPVDPWKLPPIVNLTRQGPVNLVMKPDNRYATGENSPLDVTTSEYTLLRNIHKRTSWKKQKKKRVRKKSKQN